MSFVRNLSAARVSRRCTPRSTESSFSRSPVKVWNVGQIFAFVFVGFQTLRQHTPMKPHTLSPFLSGSQPPPTNVQQAVSSQTTLSFSKSPCALRRSLYLRKFGQHEKDLQKEKMCSKRPYTRGAWLPRRRMNFGMNCFETANSQASPPATDQGPKMRQSFCWSREHLEVNGG